MAVIHTTLVDYYRENKLLVTDHNYSVRDIEAMYPYERDIIIDLILQDQQETP